tara:strand:- start:1323 stop:1625 length:303 start_codon:yes stop_codon:yes gene_type:complete
MAKTATTLVGWIKNKSVKPTSGMMADYGMDHCCQCPKETVIECWKIAIIQDKLTDDMIHKAMTEGKLNELLSTCENLKKSESYKLLKCSGGITTVWDMLN